MQIRSIDPLLVVWCKWAALFQNWNQTRPRFQDPNTKLCTQNSSHGQKSSHKTIQ